MRKGIALGVVIAALVASSLAYGQGRNCRTVCHPNGMGGQTCNTNCF